MQKAKKPFILLTVSIVAAVAFTLLRILLLTKGYDFDSGFFTHRPLATAFYITVLLFALAFIVIKKRIMLKASSGAIHEGITSRIISLFLSASFALFALALLKELTFDTLIEKAAIYLAIVTAAISSIYYLFFAFINKRTLILFNAFPILSLVSVIIYMFVKQSIYANTYNGFSGVIALGAMAFILLDEGKAQSGSEGSLLPSYIILIPLVSQSLFPDLISIKEFGLWEALLAVIKLLYLVLAIVKSVKIICEEEK